MGIFGKKKKSEEDEDIKEKDSGEKEEEKRSLKVKKIKDLSPENTKRRKEPVRAWNKFDRLFLLFLLLLSAGSAFFLALSSRGYKLPNLPRLNISQIKLFGERTIVFESENRDRKIAEEIINNFSSRTESLSGIYGFYVINIDNNFSFGVYNDEKFQAASLIQLPVMAGMYMAREDGKLNLDAKYKLRAEDKVKGSGSLYAKPVGYEVSYRELIKLIGKESDNTAFNICRKYLGDEKVQSIINLIGMKDTSLMEDTTTPQDIGLFFQKLWNGELINSTNTNEMLLFLTDTVNEKSLAEGISENVRVAHKYGRELKIVNDGGIIYANTPYITVIMTKDIVDPEADKAFSELSKIIYEGMEND
jgi:beta-lactamase class A